MIDWSASVAEIPERSCCLLVADESRGAEALKILQGQERRILWIAASRSKPAPLRAAEPGLLACAMANRLPFRRHAFEVILSLHALYATRPTWTVIAEYHRVLIPDGKLILLEPTGQGPMAAIRDRFFGPGKRVFELDEVRHRLTRADFQVDQVQEVSAGGSATGLAYRVLAIKKENLSTPVPQFSTGRELRARQKPYPKGEELP